MSLSPQNMVG